MTQHPCPDPPSYRVSFAVLTASDTRTEATDSSGQFIRQSLLNGGHRLLDYKILPDDPALMRGQVLDWAALPELEVIIINGGTGIAPRDTTYDAIAALMDKTLPGFGEMFRYLSWQEVGSRAIASRAIAGLVGGTLLFSLPGSRNAVRLAIEQLILPELVHLVRQMKGLH
ncbi:MAG: MogA/MoaB family molybdenum cofactor biosynthesis protein [Oscillatoriales cyanobacterium SM2_2_1]|nr:MogA/MoaB family molybdenum cofactor biosynthesis protein [Oscillatoriales cyanobacterium SM2_2_1]